MDVLEVLPNHPETCGVSHVSITEMLTLLAHHHPVFVHVLTRDALSGEKRAVDDGGGVDLLVQRFPHLGRQCGGMTAADQVVHNFQIFRSA